MVEPLKKQLKDAEIYPNIKHSDHCPVFLDIEMPVISGFSFLEGLKAKPQVIFVTAKAEYALRAFDYDATDYLQKPVTLNRFETAVKRALHLHSLENETKEDSGEHIFIKSNLKKLKIFSSPLSTRNMMLLYWKMSSSKITSPSIISI